MPCLGLGLGTQIPRRVLFTGLLDEFSGAAAAYSLRALSSAWLAGDVVEVRPSSGWTPASFTANQVANGELVDYVKRPGDFTNVGFDTLVNNGEGDGFTATLVTGAAQARSFSLSGVASDVVTIDFDIEIVSGSPSITLRSGGSFASNLETITTSGSKSVVLTATASYDNFTFSDADNPAEYTISNVRFSTADGFVSTWYDQSGNGNDATQATTTSQPKIVDAGSLVTGGLDFDGVDDVLSITSSIAPASFFAVASHGGGAFNRVISNGVGTSAIIANPTSYLTRFGNTTGRNMGASTTSQVLATAIDSGSSDLCGLNGATGSSGDFGSFASDSYAISSNGGWDGNINEVIIYDSDQSANRVGIETNINDFYGIY